MTEKFSNVIRHCADSLGIRERVETVNGLSIDHLKKVAEKENRSIDDMLVMSFGCGTGLATLKMLKNLRMKRVRRNGYPARSRSVISSGSTKLG